MSKKLILGLYALLTVLLLSVSSATYARSWPVVREGDLGRDVVTVQYLLRHHGYTLSVDGDFGSGTKSTVQSFQSSQGLTADGIVGTNSWERLVVTVRQGDNGNHVRAVQDQLKNRWGYSLTIDGVFGSGTANAVRSFQSSKGLSADGIVGLNTWAALVGGSSGGSGGYSLPIPRNNQPRSEYDDPHHDYPAIDLATWTGTPAYAMTSGTVSYVGGGCGYGILISGDDGASYKYCHLNSRNVNAGSRVSAGQLIGYTGNTGHSTGPHLHLELKYGGVLRCPQTFLLAIYDGNTPPSPASLPTSGCSY